MLSSYLHISASSTVGWSQSCCSLAQVLQPSLSLDKPGSEWFIWPVNSDPCMKKKEAQMQLTWITSEFTAPEIHSSWVHRFDLVAFLTRPTQDLWLLPVSAVRWMLCKQHCTLTWTEEVFVSVSAEYTQWWSLRGHTGQIYGQPLGISLPGSLSVHQDIFHGNMYDFGSTHSVFI